MDERHAVRGVVEDTPRSLLRLEGVVVVLASVVLYAASGSSWLMFAVLLLAPDAGILGYAAGARAGAVTYNLMHTYAVPVAMVAVAVSADRPLVVAIGLIWLVHIGLDRALGYGLKYDDAFGHTHLGWIGRGGGRNV